MESSNCRHELDIMVYEKIRRKQARKDFLLGGLVVFLLVLLCISVIAFWVTGFTTPQNADFRDWLALVSSIIMLVAIICFVLLILYTLLKDKDARARLFEVFKTRV